LKGLKAISYREDFFSDMVKTNHFGNFVFREMTPDGISDFVMELLKGISFSGNGFS